MPGLNSSISTNSVTEINSNSRTSRDTSRSGAFGPSLAAQASSTTQTTTNSQSQSQGVSAVTMAESSADLIGIDQVFAGDTRNFGASIRRNP